MRPHVRPDVASPSHEPRGAEDRRGIWLLLVALGLAAAAYARVLDGSFQLDDMQTIERSVAVKSLGRYLREGFWLDCAGGGRPVTNLTFALNYAVGGLEPRTFHFTNVAIHLAVSILVWAFTIRVARLAGVARAGWLAVGVAGVFALHPIQSQAVSYVSQRSESLASGFYLAALLLLLAAERHGRSWRGAAAWVGAFAAFALGLGAKAIVLTLPAAYLLLAAAVGGTAPARGALTTWRRRLALIAPFFLLGGVFAAAALRGSQGRSDAGFSVPGLSPGDYLLTQSRVVVVFLRLLFWPVGQNVDWDFPVSRDLLEPAVLACGAFLGLLAAASGVLLVKGRALRGEDGGAARLAGFGIAWFFLVLSVTSSVVPLADVLFEHRVYLASWGALVVVGVGVERAGARLRWRGTRAFLCVAAVVLWGTLAVSLYRRNAVWESREALWSDALAKSPNKPRVRLSLGFAYRSEGRYDEAVGQYVAGLALARGDLAMELQLLRNLGVAHASAGRLDAAVAAYRAGLEKAPEDPDLLMNMAAVLAITDDPGAAEPWVRRALMIVPEDAYAWSTLAAVLLEKPDLDGALLAARRAIALDPDLGSAHLSLGLASHGLGRSADACAAWRKALSLEAHASVHLHARRLVDDHCRR